MLISLYRRLRRNRLADFLVFSLIILVLLALVRFLPEPPAVNPSGPARVIDGDSIVVAGTEIRLRGIDAPEIRQPCRRNGADWACGKEAARRLRGLTGRGTVECSGNRFDRHDRLLAVCRIGGTQINRWMVEQGWAVSFDAYPGAERAARDARRGIWASDFQRPRKWRDANRDSQ